MSGMPLEEEKSTEFVFIPPEGKEAKERILTEHQKEVLKTKRFVVLLFWIEYFAVTLRFHAPNYSFVFRTKILCIL